MKLFKNIILCICFVFMLGLASQHTIYAAEKTVSGQTQSPRQFLLDNGKNAVIHLKSYQKMGFNSIRDTLSSSTTTTSTFTATFYFADGTTETKTYAYAHPITIGYYHEGDAYNRSGTYGETTVLSLNQYIYSTTNKPIVRVVCSENTSSHYVCPYESGGTGFVYDVTYTVGNTPAAATTKTLTGTSSSYRQFAVEGKNAVVLLQTYYRQGFDSSGESLSSSKATTSTFTAKFYYTDGSSSTETFSYLHPITLSYYAEGKACNVPGVFYGNKTLTVNRYLYSAPNKQLSKIECSESPSGYYAVPYSGGGNGFSYTITYDGHTHSYTLKNVAAATCTT